MDLWRGDKPGHPVVEVTVQDRLLSPSASGADWDCRFGSAWSDLLG